MKILLETAEAENFFYNSLCNGLTELRYYNLELDYKAADYAAAAKKLKKTGQKLPWVKMTGQTVCYEDVLMQILRDGKKLSIIDDGYDGDYSVSITLADVHERVALTPIGHLMDAVNETDDATTADCILQTVFFKEIVFG